MVNFGSLAAEICWRVWGTPANFNGFRVLTALLHGTLVVAVSQTLQGGHHIRHWPTLLFLSSSFFFPRLLSAVTDRMSAILLHVVRPQCEFTMQV